MMKTVLAHTSGRDPSASRIVYMYSAPAAEKLPGPSAASGSPYTDGNHCASSQVTEGSWSARIMSATMDGEYGTLAFSYRGSPGWALMYWANQPRSVPSGFATQYFQLIPAACSRSG